MKVVLLLGNLSKRKKLILLSLCYKQKRNKVLNVVLMISFNIISFQNHEMLRDIYKNI